MTTKQKFAGAVQICALLWLPCLLSSHAAAQMETWHFDPPHSAAQFAIRHMGISTVRGTFAKVGGVLDYLPSDPTKSTVDVVIDAASVDSRVEMRDKDLRSERFFDVAKYPNITFKSKRMESAGPDKFKVTGDLTIHGVTRQVVLDVDGPTPPVKDQKGVSHRGISATTTIEKDDFGIDVKDPLLGNQIEIQIDAELVDKVPGPPPGNAPPSPSQ